MNMKALIVTYLLIGILMASLGVYMVLNGYYLAMGPYMLGVYFMIDAFSKLREN